MINYFELLQIPEQYDIELEKLAQNYFKLLSKFHPDRAKSVDEKTSFLVTSTEINNAYHILKDKLKRAKYMLLLQNIDVDDEKIKAKFSSQSLSKIWLDFEFIDDNEHAQVLQKFKERKLLEQQNIIKQLASAFTKNELAGALEQTLQLRYLTNIIDNLNLKIKNVS